MEDFVSLQNAGTSTSPHGLSQNTIAIIEGRHPEMSIEI